MNRRGWRSLLTSIFLLLWSNPCFPQTDPTPVPGTSVRFETLPIPGGAELITLFFRDGAAPNKEIPLISVVRGTLGSEDPEVHRLRYLWVHTFASGSLRQRLAAATPFLYTRFGNARAVKDRVPSPVLDLSANNDRLWRGMWEVALKNLAIDPRISLVESFVRTYGQNKSLYVETQFARASTALDMENPLAIPALSASERLQLQGQLTPRTKRLARLMNSDKLEQFHLKGMREMRQTCARNWELLRQRAEAEGLYFEPLLLPDGTATHALLYAAREDLLIEHEGTFDKRFLNISKPWGDKQLLNWSGPTETRFFDNGERLVELIPLALYGLEHPKIPALLVDFRKPLNAKQREVSKRAFSEVARIGTGSPVANFFITVGRAGAGVVSQRTGMDLLQPSRMQSYSQLKLALASNTRLGADMREELAQRVERVAVNPFDNDFDTELELARNQYMALAQYARNPRGLRLDIDEDRRQELAGFTHRAATSVLFRIGHIVSFGSYTHRAPGRPDMNLILETKRKTASLIAFLREATNAGRQMDVEWDTGKVRAALQELVDIAGPSNREVADLSFKVFNQTRDEATRHVAVTTLQAVQAFEARGNE